MSSSRQPLICPSLSLRLYWFLPLLCWSCIEPSEPPESSSNRASTVLERGRFEIPVTQSALHGVWQSDGYGYVLEIPEEGIRQLHLAGDLCFVQPENSPTILQFQNAYELGADGDHLRMWSDLDPYPLHLNRLAALPSVCQALDRRYETDPDVTTNLEALTEYFDAHYCFFDLYGVNWPEAVTRAQTHLELVSNELELFALASELLAPLKDSHIQLDAVIDDERHIYDGNPGRTEIAVAALASVPVTEAGEALNAFRRNYWLHGIRDQLLSGQGVMTANGRIQYGMVTPEAGYIAVASMGGYVDGDLESMAQEPVVLAQAMEAALGLFAEKGARKVLLDLSMNIGGYDFIARKIAGYFATDRVAAYTQSACDDPEGRVFTHHVTPNEGARFTGPVVLLTSDLTVSAAEVLTLTLRALDNVIHVGQRTRGAFSTVLTKYLPNGWELSLSNEVFRDHEGVLWEGRGVKPQVELEVFNATDPVASHVAAARLAAAQKPTL